MTVNHRWNNVPQFWPAKPQVLGFTRSLGHLVCQKQNHSPTVTRPSAHWNLCSCQTGEFCSVVPATNLFDISQCFLGNLVVLFIDNQILYRLWMSSYSMLYRHFSVKSLFSATSLVILQRFLCYGFKTGKKEAPIRPWECLHYPSSHSCCLDRKTGRYN